MQRPNALDLEPEGRSQSLPKDTVFVLVEMFGNEKWFSTWSRWRWTSTPETSKSRELPKSQTDGQGEERKIGFFFFYLISTAGTWASFCWIWRGAFHFCLLNFLLRQGIYSGFSLVNFWKHGQFMEFNLFIFFNFMFFIFV